MRRTSLCLILAVASCSVTSPDEPASSAADACVRDLPAADLETEHLWIHNGTGGPICQGTLVELESQVQRLIEVLGLPLDAPIPLDYGMAPVMESCGYEAEVTHAGCTRGMGCETHVATTFGSQVHELVHAVRRRNGIAGPPILEEGLAVVLGDGHALDSAAVGVSILPEVSMLDLLELGQGDLTAQGYAYGGHFTAFLMEEHGVEVVTAMMADPRLSDEAVVLFDEYLGESLAELDRRWRTEAWGTWYDFGEPCREEVELGAGFEESGVVDCESEGTVGHFGGPVLARPSGRCFVTEERVRVRIAVESGEGTVTLLGHECVAEDYGSDEVTTGVALRGPVEEEHTLGRCRWSVRLEAGEVGEVVELGVQVVPVP